MFKNRSVQVRMVKDTAEQSAPTLLTSVDFEKIDKTLREYTKKVAIGAVLVYAAVKTIDTASEIAVNNCK